MHLWRQRPLSAAVGAGDHTRGGRRGDGLLLLGSGRA